MNNFIEYFYNIKIDKILYNEKYYSFIYNDYVYRLYIYDNSNITLLNNINKYLVGNTLVSEIIVNRNGILISSFNSIDYILIKIYVNINKNISLDEISFLAKTMYNDKITINWGILWGNKIDYLEDVINENGKKYPLIVDSFNYFVGMAENAISYYNNIIIPPNYKYVISHKKIKFDDTIEAIYNPLNIIFDYKVRDIAEYIKNAFFKNNYNIFEELNAYLYNNSLSIIDVKLLISRLLYPSFYFDIYEDIVTEVTSEKKILDIVDRIDEYEEYLNYIITFLKKNYDIEEILWLKKRSS